MSWQQGVLIGVVVAFICGCAASDEMPPKTRLLGAAFGLAMLGIIISI